MTTGHDPAHIAIAIAVLNAASPVLVQVAKDAEQACAVFTSEQEHELASAIVRGIGRCADCAYWKPKDADSRFGLCDSVGQWGDEYVRVVPDSDAQLETRDDFGCVEFELTKNVRAQP